MEKALECGSQNGSKAMLNPLADCGFWCWTKRKEDGAKGTTKFQSATQVAALNKTRLGAFPLSAKGKPPL